LHQRVVERVQNVKGYAIVNTIKRTAIFVGALLLPLAASADHNSKWGEGCHRVVLKLADRIDALS